MRRALLHCLDTCTPSLQAEEEPALTSGKTPAKLKPKNTLQRIATGWGRDAHLARVDPPYRGSDKLTKEQYKEIVDTRTPTGR